MKLSEAKRLFRANPVQMGGYKRDAFPIGRTTSVNWIVYRGQGKIAVSNGGGKIYATKLEKVDGGGKVLVPNLEIVLFAG